MARHWEKITGSKWLGEGIEWRLDRLLAIPDEAATWRGPAIRRGVEVCRSESVDVVYATGWPWSSFLVAKAISDRTGVPFVIDYRDLWRPSDAAWDRHSIVQRLVQPHLERFVQAAAAEIITTTESFARELRKVGAAQRITCITNGYNPADFPAVDRSAPRGPRTMLAYTGVWRPGYGPDDLYDAITLLQHENPACLETLRVYTAGFAPGRAVERGIDTVITELGRVSHDEAIRLMVSADAVYLPVSGGVYEKASLPGKLFEYIGSNTPIIASAPCDSEVGRVLAEVGGAVRVEPRDVRALARTVADVAGRSGVAKVSPRDVSAASRYSRDYQCADLASVLNRVARSRG
jgi:hypothetical protein